MNLSEVEKRFTNFQKKWFEAKHKEDVEISKLLTVDYFHPTSWSRSFVAYVQPPLTALYVAFSICVLYVLIKNNMICFVNFVIILSNVIVLVPMVLAAPLIVVFFIFVDNTVPIPHPWCYIFMHLETSIKSIANTTALSLKILLGVNRVCSVYRPFETKIWFTKRKCIIYCLITCIVCITVSSLLNFTYERVTVKPNFDNIWGKIRNYDACSLDPSITTENKTTAIYVSNVILVLLNIFGLVAMVACNVLLVIKLRRIKARRKNMTQIQKETDSRINLLNKIAVWVITASVITEIPSFISKVIGLIGLLHFAYHGSDSSFGVMGAHDMSQMSFYVFYYIDLVIFAPLDLLIFVMLSAKTKEAMKRSLCCKESN